MTSTVPPASTVADDALGDDARADDARTVASAPTADGGAPADGGAGVVPLLARGRGLGRWLAAVAGALLVYAAFLVAKGADPIDVLRSMWESASADSWGETLIRATPLVLAALAVAVPARAGLFNIGGEGQLLMGAIGGMAMSRALGDGVEGAAATALVLVAGAVGGAAWALIPALLRVVASTNEAITSLLLNYTAGLVLTWLVFEPWKDPASLGQAYSESVPPSQELPVVWGNRVHAGIFVAVVAAGLVWAALRWTRWGFRLQVLGGNPEAARRAGFVVGGLTLGAFALGGALAGLGGAIELVGVEGRLRPEMMAGFGFIGFLASWLVRHDPLKVLGSSFLLAAIAVGGTGLKISSGLSGGAVNVLMALVLLAILGWGRPRRREA